MKDAPWRRRSDLGSSVGAAASVLVVDDHELVGASIAMAVTSLGFGAHLCPITNTASILRVADKVRPDLILLDLDLGVGSGLERVDELVLIAAFRARGWRTLVVSAATDSHRVAAAVTAGAIGFVAKAAALDVLLNTIRDAALGRPVLSEADRANWLDIHRKASSASRVNETRLRRLTSREREVLERLARGERAAAIASSAVVSLATVRSQIRSILTKLEVNSQLEAVAMLR